MSSRKSNKFTESEVEQVVETVVEDVVINTEAVVEPEVIDQSPVVEEQVINADVEQVEAERLNRVNDVEKQIIQHQESIKQLRSELKKLEGKTKREGPTKMELATEYFKSHPGLARKEYVEAFMKELGLTQAGARTYIQLILTKNK